MGTLYYQTLAYMYRNPKCPIQKIRGSEIENIVCLCNKCIEDLKNFMDVIHEPTDEDIDKI